MVSSEKLKKITYVANLFPSKENPSFGTFVKNSRDDLARRGWQTETIVLPEYGSGLKGYALFYASAFKKLLNQEHPVYVHYVSHSAPPVVLAKLFNWKLPIILHYHGSDGFPESSEGTVRRALKRLVCNSANLLATVVIAPSNGFLARLRSSYSLKSKRSFVSPSGGVDTSVFHDTASELRSIDLVFAGRMIPGKGGMEAAQVSLQVLRALEDSTALFVGTGPEREQMQVLLAEHIASGRVRFRPALPQAELAGIYRAARVFLFPSTRKGESLGLTWVEAAMCGALPLVLRNGITENLLPPAMNQQLSAQGVEMLAERSLHFLADGPARDHAVASVQSALAMDYSADEVSSKLDAFLTDAFQTTGARN
jgi:glycosyltransferase involved in cell wall biosynthesis